MAFAEIWARAPERGDIRQQSCRDNFYEEVSSRLQIQSDRNISWARWMSFLPDELHQLWYKLELPWTSTWVGELKETNWARQFGTPAVEWDSPSTSPSSGAWSHWRHWQSLFSYFTCYLNWWSYHMIRVSQTNELKAKPQKILTETPNQKPWPLSYVKFLEKM